MKKIFVLLMMLGVSSCYLKGDYTLGKRNVVSDFFYTYAINFYDSEKAEDAVIETETISDYKINVARHAVDGGLVLSSKIIRKEIYSDAYVRPSCKGGLVSYTFPVEFSDEKVYRAFGESKINGKTYRLIKMNRVGDIILIDERGNINQRIGRVYNDRLSLLESSFLLEPEDAIFLNETKNRLANEDIMSGFEVRYKGINDYKMVFEYTYIDEDGVSGVGDVKEYEFPMYDNEVSFEGIKLKILEADEYGIDYKVLSI